MNEKNEQQRALFSFQLSLDKTTANLNIDKSVTAKEGIAIVVHSALDIAMKAGYLDGSETSLAEIFGKLDYLNKAYKKE